MAEKPTADMQRRIMSALSRSTLFKGLSADALAAVARFGELVRYAPDDTLVREGERSDSMFVILTGDAAVTVRGDKTEDIEVARLGGLDTVGEMGLVRGEKRSATVVARSSLAAVRFDESSFKRMFGSIPGFGIGLCQSLANRLAEADQQMSLPQHDSNTAPDDDAFTLLPTAFMQRHQVVPVQLDGNKLTLGFVNDPSRFVVNAVRQQLPSLEFRAVRIDRRQFDEALRNGAVATSPTTKGGTPRAKPRRTGKIPPLDDLLRRMVTEGASDIHLSGKHVPRWRVDGDIAEISDLPELGETEVLALMQPAMKDKDKAAFERDNDADFAYEVEDVARFRVNLFRDHNGIGTVIRQIPSKILSFEQLALPEVLRTFTSAPTGLVLVTGPTGSGKSTTLAAMIDQINHARREHIITLEDPIEFVHKSDLSLVNQREVHTHTTSFHRALKAALREDPDIVLVGELRDPETMALAMETANTGHLVFGTLHTNTAVSTIERVLGMYPADQQPLIRQMLADTLRGVVAQCLLKKIGGGRVAGLEILVVNRGISNLIREGKTFQIPSMMSAGRGVGNRMLNDHLLQLVVDRKALPGHALAKSPDKDDLTKKFLKANVRMESA